MYSESLIDFHLCIIPETFHTQKIIESCNNGICFECSKFMNHEIVRKQILLYKINYILTERSCNCYDNKILTRSDMGKMSREFTLNQIIFMFNMMKHESPEIWIIGEWYHFNKDSLDGLIFTESKLPENMNNVTVDKKGELK